MDKEDYFIIGSILGFIVGAVVGYLVSRSRSESVVFERDDKGRITAIHYVKAR